MTAKKEIAITEAPEPGCILPIPETVTLLGEDDFTEAMQGANKQWRDTCVHNGKFTTKDGMEINYYTAIPENRRANLVILHGYCGFWAKYHEMAWYYYQAGYAVFFMEQRGHGYSGREVPETDLVHVRSYEDYVRDTKEFFDRVVKAESDGKPCYLFAHSMGGAIGALFLGTHPECFQKAVLSSPMIQMKTGKYPRALVNLLAVHATVHHMQRQMSVGQDHFSPVPVFGTSSTLSRPRYDYVFQHRLQDFHYQTYGASYGWAMAGMSVTRKILKRAANVKIPVLLFQAGNDPLVEPSGQLRFARKASDVRIVRYEKSKHEIFNATEEIRRDYYARIFRFLEE